MERIKTFGLVKDSVFYGYRIIKSLGCGWTAEVYLAECIITGAKRAIKIFENYEDSEIIRNQKRAVNYAMGLHMAEEFGITPRFYHVMMCYINDKLGNFCIVQEYIKAK